MIRLAKDSKGFTAIEAMLILIAVGIIGFTGWYVWQANRSASDDLKPSSGNVDFKHKKAKPTQTTAVDPTADWQTASFELANVAFKYPKTLKMTHEVKPDAANNTGFETYTLTASDNTMISLVAFHFFGGFTGDEPKHLIDSVLSGNDKTNNREFSAIIFKNDNAVYDNAYVVDSTQTKYKAGEQSQIQLTAFGVQPKGANTGKSKLSISIGGQKYVTYKTLSEIKSIGAYQDMEKFLGALNIPTAN